METGAQTPAIGAGYRALVVDDEVVLAGVVASYLEHEQFEVCIAHDGSDALTLWPVRFTLMSLSSIWACRGWTASKPAASCAFSPMPTL